MRFSHRFEKLLIMGALALGITATSPQSASAARSCVENFSETGDWSSGKAFKSFVDVKGTTADKAYGVIGRGMAKEGFLGISVSKELGIVSAYQENAGKKTTINVTLMETEPGTLRIEGAFTLAPGLRAPAGAAMDDMCRLLELAVSPGERTDAASDAAISLNVQRINKPLKSVTGTFQKVGMKPFITFYFDFSGARSEIRISERRPVILVRSKTDPRLAYVLVKCDPSKSKDKRSVKVASAGKLLKAGFTGNVELEPDEDWTVPTDITEQSRGLWRIVPTKDLKPGEYGLWDIQAYGVAFFGVD